MFANKLSKMLFLKNDEVCDGINYNVPNFTLSISLMPDNYISHRKNTSGSVFQDCKEKGKIIKLSKASLPEDLNNLWLWLSFVVILL